MKIVSIAIQKGGSGKTTTAINLAAALQQMGHTVLLVDLDPQANLTQSMGFLDERETSIYALLKQVAFGQSVDLDPVIVAANGLDLVPSALDLADAELELVSIYGREKLLRQLLKPVRERYDFIFIDCPPSVGMLTVNALAASDYVLLPLQAEFLPLKGVSSFMRLFSMIKKQVNKKLTVLGILLTKYDRRKVMNRHVLDQLTKDFGPLVFETKIRTNIALASAQQKGVDIFSYDRSANGAYDYLRLAQEFLSKIE